MLKGVGELSEWFKRVLAGLRRDRTHACPQAVQEFTCETKFPMGILWVYPLEPDVTGKPSMAEVTPYYGDSESHWTQMEIFLSDWILMSFGLNWRLVKVVDLGSPQDLPRRKQPELEVFVQDGICRLARGSAFEDFNGIINVDLGEVYYDEALGSIWAGEVTNRAFQISPNVRLYVESDGKLTAVSMLIGNESELEEQEAWEMLEQEPDPFAIRGLEFVTLPQELEVPISLGSPRGDEYVVQVWSVNSFTVSFGNIVVFSFDETGILNGILVNKFGAGHSTRAKSPGLFPTGPLQSLVLSTKNPLVGSSVLFDVGETFYDLDAQQLWTSGFSFERTQRVSESVSVSLNSEGEIAGLLVLGYVPVALTP